MPTAAGQPVPRPTPRITQYTDCLARERGLRFDSYDALWVWSTTDLPAFWPSGKASSTTSMCSRRHPTTP